MLVVVGCLIVMGIVYLTLPQFGHLPDAMSAAKIRTSPHFKNGHFENIHETPQMTSDKGTFSVLWDYAFGKHPNKRPAKALPAVKTDLKHLSKTENVLVWFGHSSYFMQLNGMTFLVDPVFSQNASPLPYNVVPFSGTSIYRAEDMPFVDYLMITHDHWDHLDYETVKALKNQVGKVVVGLGVGSHFRRWGYQATQIIELDWNETLPIKEGAITALPARHFSGRSLFPNRSLWVSYLIETDNRKIYFGGDSGYDTHYKQIGQTVGKVDLAILDCGQYDKDWKYIHMNPKEVVQAAKDLNAKWLFAGHNSKFTIANHAWDEPLTQVSEWAQKVEMPLLTPRIGEKVLLDDLHTFTVWWLDSVNQ